MDTVTKYRGESFYVDGKWKQSDGTYLTLTSYTVLKAGIKKYPNEDATYVVGDDDLVKTAVGTDTIRVSVVASVSENIPAGNYYLEFHLESADGTAVLKGQCKIAIQQRVYITGVS
jgi:hypothetical protein